MTWKDRIRGIFGRPPKERMLTDEEAQKIAEQLRGASKPGKPTKKVMIDWGSADDKGGPQR